MTSRRDFVSQSGRAFVGAALVRPWLARPYGAQPRYAPTKIGKLDTAEGLFPHAVQPDDLKALAHAALDAAKSAGASYADIRIAQRYSIEHLSDTVRPVLGADFSYGIRAVVGSAGAFIHGCVPNAEDVATAARNAVATAQGFAAANLAATALAPTPAVQGEWTTPTHGDPFLIPLNDQGDLVKSYYAIAERIVPRFMLEGEVRLEFNWYKEYRVFAGTDGSFVSQTLYRSKPTTGFNDPAGTSGSRTYFPYVSNYLASLAKPRAGGYETVAIPELPDKLKAFAEESVEISRYPQKHFDVGRFPVVVDGGVVAQLMGQTVGVGLEADRVLGNESGATGSSYLAPPAGILGKAVINPLLTVTASRAMPHYQAVKWDDEGVEPSDYTVLKDGVVTNYHTDRETAAQLAAVTGGTARSVGDAVANDAGDRIQVRMPHLTVHHASHNASVADLCQGITRGLYFTQRSWVSADHQLSSGLVYPFPGEVFEIVRGKIGGRIKNAAIQFQTAGLWKTMSALGGESTVQETNFEISKGIPWQNGLHTASAPAAVFSAANIVDLTRSLS